MADLLAEGRGLPPEAAAPARGPRGGGQHGRGAAAAAGGVAPVEERGRLGPGVRRLHCGGEGAREGSPGSGEVGVGQGAVAGGRRRRMERGGGESRGGG